MQTQIQQFAGTVTKKATTVALVEVTKQAKEKLDSGAEKKVPVIVYLHGAGEQMIPQHKLNRVSLSNYVSGPVIFVTPHQTAGDTWRPDAIRLLMDNVLEKYPADEKRLYITGHSMGARGVWDTICEYPNLFAAAVPLAGYTSYLRAGRIAHMPVWAFHGLWDEVVPYIESEKMVDALRNNGNISAYLTALKARHYINDEVYGDVAVFRWMLEQTNEKFDRSH